MAQPVGLVRARAQYGCSDVIIVVHCFASPWCGPDAAGVSSPINISALFSPARTRATAPARAHAPVPTSASPPSVPQVDYVQARTHDGVAEIRLVERWGLCSKYQRRIQKPLKQVEVVFQHLAVFASELQCRLLYQLLTAHTYSPLKTALHIPAFESVVVDKDEFFTASLVLHPQMQLFVSNRRQNLVYECPLRGCVGVSAARCTLCHQKSLLRGVQTRQRHMPQNTSHQPLFPMVLFLRIHSIVPHQ